MSERKGVVLVLVLIGAAVMMSVAGLLLLVALATGGEPAIPSNSTLVIRLGGTLDELAPSGFSQLFTSPPTVRDVVDSLHRAKTDPDISAVILAPGGAAPFWAKVQEIRDAVLDFKASGKPIIGYLEYGGEQGYYLATACDRVYLMPTSMVELTGLASYELFLRGGLDKIGAVPDMLHIGEYKTAANVYMDKTYTAAHREMAESLNDDLYGQIVAGIAEARGKTDAEVRAMFDHGPYLAKEALDAGLVDGLAYRDEINDRAALPGDADRTVDLSTYRRGGDTFSFTSRPRIAVVYAVGLIASGDGGTDPVQGNVVGSDQLARYLRRAREDRSIRAIVLRVDSPGGSAIAADAIWREMERTRSAKPLIVSMSDLAASGGYYIALPAHAIVAEPATLTGSIGVVVGKVAYGGTLDKLGLNLEAVSTGGPYAQMDSPVRPFTDVERTKMTEMMQATYDTFVRKVAEARHTTPAAIDAIARGRVWTGRQAKAHGLVDELGGLTRALELAKERAGLDPAADVSIVVYPPRKSLFETLADPFASSRLRLAAALGADGQRALGLLTAPFARFRRGEPLALMPNVYLR